MRGETEAVNILVSLTLICAFVFVYSDIDVDVLNEILHKILSWCARVSVAIVLLMVFIQSRMDVFRELSRELGDGIVQNLGNSGLLGPRRHHASCHCHTIREGTSGFMVQKLKHDLIKKIYDGVYQVNVENIGNVIYNVAPRVDSLSRESYNLAVACSNEFVLKNIFCFNPNCNQVCYVMEHYEQNFKQWLQENSLSDQQGKNLNPEFLQILRDVLRGIGYLHRVKNRCHGKLSETNIVVVNGRAKITGMVGPRLQDHYSDYKHLATIVRKSFETEQHDIPTELKLFLTYISKTEPSRLLNIENHPIFLSPLQRLSYRVIAHTILYFGKSKRSFALALNEKLGKCEWKLNVRTTGTFVMVLDRYNYLGNLSEKQRKKIVEYKDSAISFMRFCRNVVAHLKDNNVKRDPGQRKKLTVKEVEEELNGYWPEFMPILHEILLEHGHLMVVHDAVLK
ncbi:uncharacterized protein LOC126710549 isoform X2 [Quercus robur]|uniref:uncharacterized protein LOC126710549 isoform X2 n=1 Tax=Quercus robur TaxID=38942 RepID=UPI00216350BE|nr:uncharacterized protein LOC126710549 isoform X2 [Quercus robur]